MEYTTPTPEQIANTQANINNMMDWVNHIHGYLEDIINETYDYINLEPKIDPGAEFVSDLIYAMISGGIGEIDGGGMLGSFLGGLFNSYVGTPPRNLQGVIAGVWDRFDKNFLQANTDLAFIYNDVPGHWSTYYKNPVSGMAVAVSAWGNAVTVPSKTSNLYQTMTNDAVAAYKLNLAKALLPLKYYVVGDSMGVFLNYKTDKEVLANIKLLQSKNLAYYVQAGHALGGAPICPPDGYLFIEPFIGTGPIDSLADAACSWLFKDNGWGIITNENGLATRKDVFCSWGLKGSMDINTIGKIAAKGTNVPNAGDKDSKPASKAIAETSEIPLAELEADKKIAEQWHAKFAKIPRVELEQRIIDRALEDPVFCQELIKRPRKTVEKFLGMPLPKNVSFEVIQERAGEYKMILPYAGNAQRRKNKSSDS